MPAISLNAVSALFGPTFTGVHAVPSQWNSSGPLKPGHAALPATQTSSGANAMIPVKVQNVGMPPNETPPCVHSAGGVRCCQPCPVELLDRT